MTFLRRLAVPATAVTLVATTAGPGLASADGGHGDRRCARELDAAIVDFDAAFAARDLDAYMAYYVDNAVQVDSQGQIFVGKQAITDYIGAVMANEYTFTATVVTTTRDRCRSAAVVEDSVFAIPARDFTLPLVDGVSWIRTDGDWKVVQVQNTAKPVT